jgi:hypothetical protein
MFQFGWQNSLPEGAARDIFAKENEVISRFKINLSPF